MGSIKRGILAIVVAGALTALADAAPALAGETCAGCSPWWHLTSSARPTYLQSGQAGKIVVTAANLGDANLEAGTTPVTIIDKLPAGLKAVRIEGGWGQQWLPERPVACSLKSLRCTFSRSLPPYDSIEIVIGVEVEEGAKSGELNEVSVEGGNARKAAVTRPITVVEEGTPTPFGVEQYELMPEEEGGALDTRAGSHPFQLTTTLMLNEKSEGAPGTAKPVALAKDLYFKLPAGLIGNPSPFQRCTLAQFNSIRESTNECPIESVVGVARLIVNLNMTQEKVEPLVPPVFNLEPAVGEPARFGFLLPGTPVILDTSVRTGGDYGVTVSATNISQVANLLGSQVTFWGVPGDSRHDGARGSDCLDRAFEEEEFLERGRGSELPACNRLGQQFPPPLLALPTSCTGPLQTSMQADSWAQQGSFQSYGPSEPLPSLDGCNRLPFSPSISVAPDGQAASTPTGLTVGVHVPQDLLLNPTGLAESDVKDTTVTLPAGVALNPAAADGLESCSEEQVALSSDTVPVCPEASKVGTVTIKSPLLPNALEGAAYLAAQNQNPFGSLVALYLVAQDPVSGTLVKLAGEVKPDPVTGQLVSTFLNTPQLPFEDLTLHFFGGSRAPLSTPALCGTYTTSASFVPWSGTPPSSPSSSFQIVSGPNGSPCANPLPFGPSLTAGTTSIQAGGFSPFTMTMSREDGNQNLRAIALHMPAGLSGVLSGLKLCAEQQADEGTCGPGSEIGETIVSVGLGGDPFSVRGGKMYMTGPYEGAPFGLSIVNPAKAGPFDLEKNTPCDCIVVRAKIEVDPHTAALTITSDSSGPYAIPQMIDGIPLQIKHVNVTVNRAAFTFNPTNCSKLAVTGTLTSSEGSTSAVAVPFQATNCAVLAFKPAFKASTSGKTSRAKGASLNVKLTYPKAPQGSEANIAKVKVDLPKQLPSRLTTLQKACPAATFESNPAACPSASVVGHAKAITPIIPVPLEGPAYFVSHGGEAFPSLIVVLQGYGVTVDLVGTTFISKAGITSSTFKTVPDVPVGSFELTLPEGKYSALAANGNLCKSKLAMPTAFTAQNGAVIHQSTPIAVTGCPKHKAKKASKARRASTHKPQSGGTT